MNREFTRLRQVGLYLSAEDIGGSGVSMMRFSEDGITWTTAEHYQTRKSFNLSTGDGLKTVYVQFADSNGNWMEGTGVSDQIILDTIVPVGTITINNGIGATNSLSVTFQLDARDEGSGMGDGAQMQFSYNNRNWDSPIPYASDMEWHFPEGGSYKRIYVRFMDCAGNWSNSIRVVIAFDRTPPEGRVVINGGAGYTGSLQVLLEISEIDPHPGLVTTDSRPELVQMQFSNDEQTWSDAEAYVGQKEWDLSYGLDPVDISDGQRTLFAKFRDEAGNWSAPFRFAIILDRIAPRIIETAPPAGSTFHEGNTLTFSMVTDDIDPSPQEYQISLDNVVVRAWNSSADFSQSASAGTHMLKFEARDIGGVTAYESEICVYRRPIAPPHS